MCDALLLGHLWGIIFSHLGFNTRRRIPLVCHQFHAFDHLPTALRFVRWRRDEKAASRLRELQNVGSLDGSSTDIQEPDVLIHSFTLTKLDLSNTAISRFPFSPSGFPKLRKL